MEKPVTAPSWFVMGLALVLLTACGGKETGGKKPGSEKVEPARQLPAARVGPSGMDPSAVPGGGRPAVAVRPSEREKPHAARKTGTASEDPGPLASDRMKVFLGPPSERAPRKRAREEHFYVGNENELFLFYPYLKDLGGAYAGVGSDQAYLFIGWMRPEFSWLTDYDQAVADLHHVHHAFFLKAEDPDAFVDLWSEKSRNEAEKVIRDRYPDHRRLGGYLRVYRKARPEVHPRLGKVRRVMLKRSVPCYLTDSGTYRFVRNSIRRNRVRPMVADLRGTRALVGVGEASRKLGVPVRAFYVSNAEEYWKWFPDQYRRNVFGLFFDERSVVIRTMTRSREKSTYTYHVQPAKNFVAWLKLGRIGRIHQFKRRLVKRVRNASLFVADQVPPAGKPFKHRGR